MDHPPPLTTMKKMDVSFYGDTPPEVMPTLSMNISPWNHVATTNNGKKNNFPYLIIIDVFQKPFHITSLRRIHNWHRSWVDEDLQQTMSDPA
jgi:hypothetical protein